MPHGARTLRAASEVLSRIELVRINARVLSCAATMDPADLRTLDAIHLATASLLEESLHRFVCYDGRLASAANAGDWTVMSPDRGTGRGRLRAHVHDFPDMPRTRRAGRWRATYRSHCNTFSSCLGACMRFVSGTGYIGHARKRSAPASWPRSVNNDWLPEGGIQGVLEGIDRPSGRDRPGARPRVHLPRTARGGQGQRRGSGFRGRDNRPRVVARIRRCRDEPAGAGARGSRGRSTSSRQPLRSPTTQPGSGTCRND